MIELRGTCSTSHLVINVVLVDENCFGASDSLSCCTPTWSLTSITTAGFGSLVWSLHATLWRQWLLVRRPQSQAKSSLTHNFSGLYVVFYITQSLLLCCIQIRHCQHRYFSSYHQQHVIENCSNVSCNKKIYAPAAY